MAVRPGARRSDRPAPAVRVIDAAAVDAALPFPALVAALRALFITGCESPPRHVHHLAAPGGPGVTSLVMPAWTRPGAEGPARYGLKVINIAPGNAARGLPGLHASYLLHDGATGVPLALIAGDPLTARRTAATSALAGSFLARPDARSLLVVGAGRIAALLPAAWAAVRPIARVRIWARRHEAAEALAADLAARGFAAEAAPRLDEAVAAADIVSCATLATEPVVRGAWLAPGSHLDLIGSFTPAMREADDDCWRGAGLWLDTEEALAKSGDLVGPLERGALRAADLRGTLQHLCRGEAAGRADPRERTVFKSVGTALEDLAAAMLVLQAQGAG